MHIAQLANRIVGLMHKPAKPQSPHESATLAIPVPEDERGASYRSLKLLGVTRMEFERSPWGMYVTLSMHNPLNPLKQAVDALCLPIPFNEHPLLEDLVLAKALNIRFEDHYAILTLDPDHTLASLSLVGPLEELLTLAGPALHRRSEHITHTPSLHLTA